MSFGVTTVTFISETPSGARGKLGTQTPAEARVDVPGCRFRPLYAREMPEDLTNLATQVWRCTAPPEAAAIVAKSTGVLEVEGVKYRIIGGARPFEDFTNPFKVTIDCQRNPA
jgi:hypothetical protein